MADAVSSSRWLDRAVGLQVTLGPILLAELVLAVFMTNCSACELMTELMVLQRIAQSGGFLATSEMVLFQLTGGSKVRSSFVHLAFILH